MVKVKVERLDKSIPLPSRQKGAASGFDLYASGSDEGRTGSGYIVSACSTVYIGSGIAIELPAGYEAIVRGRSSLSKKGLVCSIGTIDEDYRGEIGVVLSNTTRVSHHIETGDRIAQLVIQKKAEVELVEVDEVDTDTVRGEDGWGSSGKGLEVKFPSRTYTGTRGEVDVAKILEAENLIKKLAEEDRDVLERLS